MLSQLWLPLLSIVAAVLVADARQFRKQEIHAKQAEAAKRWHINSPVKRAQAATTKNITFSNPKASRKSSLSTSALVL